MKYRESIRNNDINHLNLSNEEENDMSIEQLKGKIIMNDAKIKKPE